MTDQPVTRSARPSRALLLTEAPRALGETLRFALEYPWLRRLPQGEPHPVMVLPGFLATDGSTWALRRVLGDLGYPCHGWGLGRNTGFSKDLLEAMRARLGDLRQRHGQALSLVGQSLGGLYAHILAHTETAAVRQVISLGSPLGEPGDSTNVDRLYGILNGAPPARPTPMRERLRRAPPVPVCAIYSRGDGIVHWRMALAPPGHARVESVEISGSHVGMGFNPQVIRVLADRLATDPAAWRPYRP
jgi:pimeloyl-ACP methyl ester carboxylesterase